MKISKVFLKSVKVSLKISIFIEQNYYKKILYKAPSDQGFGASHGAKIVANQ